MMEDKIFFDALFCENEIDAKQINNYLNSRCNYFTYRCSKIEFYIPDRQNIDLRRENRRPIQYKTYLSDHLEYSYEKNFDLTKQGVKGYHAFKAKYDGDINLVKGRDMELKFEESTSMIKFHFIKFI